MSDTTVAAPPPWEAGRRPRPTWGLSEGDEIAPGRSVLRRIGGGRRYEAMLVWDQDRLAVLVAKVLRPDQARDAAALQDLAHEAALLERLAHPVLVRSFGAVTEGRFPHLVLEHLDGPTLDELLGREGPLALEQLLPLALHVASALHYLAGEGVVHLDVKPSKRCDGRPAAAHRPERRAHGRGGGEGARPIGTRRTWRPSSASPTAASGAGGRVRPGGNAVHRADRRQAAGPGRLPRRTPRSCPRSCTPGWTRTPRRCRPPPSSRTRSSRSSPRCRGG